MSQLKICVSVLLMAFSCALYAGDHVQESNKENLIEASATDWRSMYFMGFSKTGNTPVSLSEAQIKGLLSLVNVSAFISTGATIKPQLLINQKGLTAWLFMYLVVHSSDREALALISESKTSLLIPNDYVTNNFGSHINWPEDLLNSYQLELDGYTPFVIPFLVHKSAPDITKLNESLKSPDGSMEIFQVHEFHEDKPEKLLAEYDHIIKFINSERPDITK